MSATQTTPGRRWADPSRPWGRRVPDWIDLSRSWGRRVRAVVSGVRWYVRELTGEAAYDRYVAHCRAHPDRDLLTRTQWWRARDDDREAGTHERCC